MILKKNRPLAPHTDRRIVIFNHLNLKYVIPNNECPGRSTVAANGYSGAICQQSQQSNNVLTFYC